MHRSTPRALALGIALTAVALPVASAQAASLTVSQPCQVATFGLNAILSGFTPNTAVSVQADGILETATTDATGSVSIPFRSPVLPTKAPGSRQVILTARDTAAAPVQATAKFRTANFAFATSGGRQSPKLKRSWAFSGLTPGRAIFGHFRLGGRTRANFRFGVAKAPCGELRVKAPGIPVKGTVSSGKWTVQIDQKGRFDKRTLPRLTGSTTVFKVFKP